MSSDRPLRRIVLLGLLGLAGCGFAPVHGSGEGLRDRIAFASDDSVAGYRLREQLERRLGTGRAADMQLTASVGISQRAAAITADGDTARLNLIGTATWVLRDLATGDRVDNGRVEAFTSYSATGTTVATQAAQDDAEERLAIILADLIVSRLLAAQMASDG